MRCCVLTMKEQRRRRRQRSDRPAGRRALRRATTPVRQRPARAGDHSASCRCGEHPAGRRRSARKEERGKRRELGRRRRCKESCRKKNKREFFFFSFFFLKTSVFYTSFRGSSSSGSSGHRPLQPLPPGPGRSLHPVPERCRELHHLPQSPRDATGSHDRCSGER